MHGTELRETGRGRVRTNYFELFQRRSTCDVIHVPVITEYTDKRVDKRLKIWATVRHFIIDSEREEHDIL
jgi:hypothetical protein